MYTPRFGEEDLTEWLMRITGDIEIFKKNIGIPEDAWFICQYGDTLIDNYGNTYRNLHNPPHYPSIYHKYCDTHHNKGHHLCRSPCYETCKEYIREIKGELYNSFSTTPLSDQQITKIKETFKGHMLNTHSVCEMIVQIDTLTNNQDSIMEKMKQFEQKMNALEKENTELKKAVEEQAESSDFLQYLKGLFAW